MTGEFVHSFKHESYTSGNAIWDLRTINNQEIAPGFIYITLKSVRKSWKVRGDTMKRLVITFLFFFSSIYGQYRDSPEVVTKVATSAANWLKIETSARAIGMGGAHVASGRGLSGIPYNPASVAFIEQSEVHFSMVNYLAGIKHGVLSYGRKMGPSDFIGLHLFYLDSGPMAVTNEFYQMELAILE